MNTRTVTTSDYGIDQLTALMCEWGWAIFTDNGETCKPDPEDTLRKEPAYGKHVARFYNSKGQVEQAANVINE